MTPIDQIRKALEASQRAFIQGEHRAAGVDISIHDLSALLASHDAAVQRADAHWELLCKVRAEIDLKIAEMQERCARECERHMNYSWNDDRKAQAKLCADAIRAIKE